MVSVKGNVLAVRGRGWCPEFRRLLREEATKADVVHNHGLWMWPNAYAREAAVAAGKPLIISPRGMLEAWSLGRSKLRKAVAWRLFERKNVQSAVMFHATAASEARSIEEILSHSRPQGDGVRRSRGQINASGEKASHGLTRIKGRISPGGCADRTGGECSSPGTPGSRNASSNEDGIKLKTTTGVPIVVAPNGVDLPDLGRRPGREILEKKFPQLKDRRWVVFMSRLHPKKGSDVLLRAWRKQQNVEHGAGLPARSAYRSERSMEQGASERKETKRPIDQETKDSPLLVLAGPDLIGYRKDIERMIKELGLGHSVVITGEVAGEEKDCLLANADVFVLPSYSENFGIVVAEAMAWGRPVIASTGTPWKEIADVGAGWWVKPEEDALAQALHEALGKGREQLDAMGAKGRALVEHRYTWAEPAGKLVRAYEEISDRKTKRQRD
jgi:glycosyltransferase involved in cell wall biosynthesis